ncbi:probable serine/threonine-protein kinase At1g54610 [Prunus dulcis]|uniref:probable serine/threonine-protein kinase At1g54610 n=1 Tax=Prunus dulcis TaxID=3755 RepID=UPI001482BACF|nr:probable serine/threonine-protein kinase At1g54610 [Prunus dulcis]
MGCVQTKTNSPTHGLQGLHKLKLDHGYVKGGKGGKPISQKHSRKDIKVVRFNREEKVVDEGGVGVPGGGGGGGGEGVIGRETEKGKNGGNVSGRITLKQIGGDDDTVGGWPKWLVENVPEDVLSGLVPKTADSYDKLAKVGQGTYSNVYKARDRDTKKIVALKKVRFDTSEPESVKFMAREITILQQLDHPNIIKLEGIATSRMQYSLYLVFDFMQSDLTRVVSRPGQRLTEPQVKCYMQQLLAGLQHCHENGILHRDIKASNLLIDKSGMLKIADFGLANSFPPKKRPLTSRVVTLWYRAPELLLGSTDYGVGIDLWSAGCLLAEMFVGRPVMPGRTEVEQLHRIFKLCGSPGDDYWKKMKLPTSFRPPQHYKPSFEEFFRDFSTSSFGLLTTLLALYPASRGSAASALQSDFFSSSPLACDLSALPVMYKGEDEWIHTRDRRKRASKPKQLSQTNRELHQRKVQEVRGEFESSNKFLLEKKAEPNMYRQATGSSYSQDMESMHSQEMGSMHSQEKGSNSASSSTSSNFKPSIYENLHASFSPTIRSHKKRFPTTEGHPYALKNINPDVLKNIKDFPLLRASITDIAEGSALSYYHRSHSTLDFRNLDPEKM